MDGVGVGLGVLEGSEIEEGQQQQRQQQRWLQRKGADEGGVASHVPGGGGGARAARSPSSVLTPIPDDISITLYLERNGRSDGVVVSAELSVPRWSSDGEVWEVRNTAVPLTVFPWKGEGIRFVHVCKICFRDTVTFRGRCLKLRLACFPRCSGVGRDEVVLSPLPYQPAACPPPRLGYKATGPCMVIKIT